MPAVLATLSRCSSMGHDRKLAAPTFLAMEKRRSPVNGRRRCSPPGWRADSLGDGALVELEVVAILQDRLGLPSILLPWTMAAAHSSVPMADIVYVAVDWGADVSAIEAAVGPAIVTGSDSYLTTLDAEFDRLSRLALLAIVGIAVVYSGVSIANTHTIASAGRADEFAALRLAGATPRQVRCIASYEALLGVLVGTVLAIAVVATSLISLVIALAPIASTVPISVPWLLLGAIVTACGVIAVLGSLAPMAITNQRLANVGDNRYTYG